MKPGRFGSGDLYGCFCYIFVHDAKISEFAVHITFPSCLHYNLFFACMLVAHKKLV